ncbi:hypothetical protein BaRGS_00028355 [Batillaria attramentaria]|uniref:Uncharacterized protein n=1 Tax=Batillaria attramentaria TaxID=370345 RepID=A0ABD0K0J8_9CAEN
MRAADSLALENVQTLTRFTTSAPHQLSRLRSTIIECDISLPGQPAPLHIPVCTIIPVALGRDGVSLAVFAVDIFVRLRGRLFRVTLHSRGEK